MNRALKIFVTMLMGLLAAGCARVAHKVDVLYTPIASYRGGSGSLDLFVGDTGSEAGSATDIHRVIGHIRNSGGKVTGEITSSICPQDVLIDGFKQELSSAGYQVGFSMKPDKYTSKGVAFTDISIQLEEVQSLAKLESTCTILVKMDLWKSGDLVKRNEYRSRLTDIAVVNRDQLPRDLFKKAIHEIMQQAVPDIIQLFD